MYTENYFNRLGYHEAILLITLSYHKAITLITLGDHKAYCGFFIIKA